VATPVLIAGGGVAALEAALALRELGEDRVSVEMLAPDCRRGDLLARGHSPASTPEAGLPKPRSGAPFLTTFCLSPVEPARPRQSAAP
jgi:hypothetical protein